MRYLASCFMLISLLLSYISTIRADDAPQPIIVNIAKPTVVIKMQSNPSTGYCWLLQNYDHALMSLVSHGFVTPKAKLMGAPGIETWTFNLKPEAFLAPQLIEVNFLYTRAWDLSSGTKKTIYIVTQNAPVKKAK